MPVIKSKVDPKSDTFRKNAKANKALAKSLRELHDKISRGGGERAREKHLGRGKLLPRDRIRTLVDRGAPFL
jgi:3-methylcrotonyl-CoA carboxylase beta subunit